MKIDFDKTTSLYGFLYIYLWSQISVHHVNIKRDINLIHEHATQSCTVLTVISVSAIVLAQSLEYRQILKLLIVKYTNIVFTDKKKK